MTNDLLGTMHLPHVFRGLWCPCGASHHQQAAYYVSVQENPGSYTTGRVVLALGPLQEHSEALAEVETVRREVEARWNPDGRAHWYSYGTTAMCSSYREPGKLNAALAKRKTCLACQEDALDTSSHGWECRLYLKQRAWAQGITRRLKIEPDLTASPSPDYSTPAAVTARCRESGLWSHFNPLKTSFQRDPWKTNVYKLLASDGLYSAFACAVARSATGGQKRQS